MSTENPYESPRIPSSDQRLMADSDDRQRIERNINVTILFGILLSLIAVFFSGVVIEHIPTDPKPFNYSPGAQYDYLIIKFGRPVSIIFFLVCAGLVLTRNGFACFLASIISSLPTFVIFRIPGEFYNPVTLLWGYYLWLGSFVVLTLLSIVECYRGLIR